MKPEPRLCRVWRISRGRTRLVAEELRVKILKRIAHRASDHALGINIDHGRQDFRHRQNGWFRSRIGLAQSKLRCLRQNQHNGNKSSFWHEIRDFILKSLPTDFTISAWNPCAQVTEAVSPLSTCRTCVIVARLKIAMRPSISARANLELIEENYRRWQRDPESVDSGWSAFFEGFELGNLPQRDGAAAAEAREAALQTRVDGLVYAYRILGHTIARVDPLAEKRPENPLLSLREFGFSERISIFGFIKILPRQSADDAARNDPGAGKNLCRLHRLGVHAHSESANARMGLHATRIATGTSIRSSASSADGAAAGAT